MKKLILLTSLFCINYTNAQDFRFPEKLSFDDTIIVTTRKSSCNNISNYTMTKIFQTPDSCYQIIQFTPHCISVEYEKSSDFNTNKKQVKKFLKKNDCKISKPKIIVPTPLDSLLNFPIGITFYYQEQLLPIKYITLLNSEYYLIKNFCLSIIDSTLTLNQTSFIAGNYTLFDITYKNSFFIENLVKDRKFKGWHNFLED